MHHRLTRGQREPQTRIRRAATRRLASASILSAGAITIAMIAAPAQASAHGGPAAAPNAALPGVSMPFQEPSRYSKTFGSLPVLASERTSSATPDTTSGSGNSLGAATAVSANGQVAVVSAIMSGVCGVVYVYAERAGSWKRVQTLQPPSPSPQCLFGWQVGVSDTGATLMVDEPGLTSDPTVLIYTRNKSGVWVQSSKITGPHNIVWGQAAAMSGSGNEILVGAVYAHNRHGEALLYKKTTSGAWRLAQTWDSPSTVTGTFFGYDVALSAQGTTALVTDFNNTGLNSSVTVYKDSAGTWKRAFTITKSTAGQFGEALALSADGSTAIIGAPGVNTADKGVAYVFRQKNNSWSLEKTLSPSDGAAGDLFGFSVALSGKGTAAVVGTYFYGSTTADGVAYVFTSSAGSWSQQAKLTASDGQGGAMFGEAVALSSTGSTAIIGAPDGNNGSGEAYVFQGPGGSWKQQAAWKQGGPNAGDQFGTSVGISASGDTAVIGTRGNNEARGAAYVYTRSHSNHWVRSAELTASHGQPGAGFGEAVAISSDGSTIAVASGNYLNASTPTLVYIFHRTSTGWVQSAKLTGPAGQDNNAFGGDLSLSGDGSGLAIACPSAARVYYYIRQQDGSWRLAHHFTGLGIHGFGQDVALSSDASTLLIGELGEVFVYTQSNGKWETSAPIMYPAGASLFGTALAASANGSRAAISATGNNNSQGAMYIFSRNAKDHWREVSELTASDGQPGDKLGFSGFCPCTIGMTASGTTAVIGAPAHADNAGAAYAFSASGTSWKQAAEFTSSRAYSVGQPGAGNSDDISANGSAIIIGARSAINSAGVVYIYTPGSKGWTLAQTLVDP
jgi:hypothetical protein